MIWAVIKTQFEGCHKYPEAPEPVKYLRNLHRHVFFVEVWLEQFHYRRDIEYISFKEDIKVMLKGLKENTTNSCEMIAGELIKLIQRIKKYRGRKIRVSVVEDNENGCVLENDYEPNLDVYG